MSKKITADLIVEFFSTLNISGSLPRGINIMNPFRENNEIVKLISLFYYKYYNDNKSRHLILGINPGRFGAGVTGITFTDTKRLTEKCGIKINLPLTHEPSSVFVYEVIERYGGVQKFYSDFIVSAVCPLGFTKTNSAGKEINYNYYDSKELLKAVTPFIVFSIKKHLEFGVFTNVCFCLGAGKNFSFLSQLNKEYRFFDKIVPLEHPRFIMQYKSKKKDEYINKYLEAFDVRVKIF